MRGRGKFGAAVRPGRAATASLAIGGKRYSSLRATALNKTSAIRKQDAS